MQLMLREVVMLRNRSRAVTSNKQAIMADHNTHINQNHTPPSSSFLISPRFFNSFLSRTLSDAAENMISPTSILENTKKSAFSNPFGFNRNPPQPQIISSRKEQIHEKSDSESIGLAILDSIKDERKMVLFGAKLKVQIPSSVSEESPNSPGDFGIKTRNSQNLSPFSVIESSPQAQSLNMKLSLSEMEMSEDYTCVITHGPNPKTIHIFDDCIVDSCCGVVGVSELKDEIHQNSTNNSMDFLSFCYTCKNNLQQGKDIFMYRGEKAFCSNECRCQEMISEGEKNTDMME